jgi:hypothetical protein
MGKPKIEVTVRKDHKFRGTWRKKGEALSVTNRDAKTLAALGWAVVKREPKVVAPVEAPKPKREYKRKDIVPPQAVVMVPEAPAAEDEAE